MSKHPLMRLNEKKDLTFSDPVQKLPPRLAWSDKDIERFGFLHPRQKDQASLEAYRRLRTEIGRKISQSNFVLQVASIDGGQHSAAVARNLAATFAYDDYRSAVLVDCNLANPDFSPKAWALGPDDEVGLADLLDNPGIGVERVLLPSGIPRLRLVWAGKPRSERLEYFSGPIMTRLLAELKRRYRDRVIILNSPPLAHSTDAMLLSRIVDAILPVVPEMRSTRVALKDTLQRLDRSRIVGVAFQQWAT